MPTSGPSGRVIRFIGLMLAVACLLWAVLAAAQNEPSLKEIQQALQEEGFDPGPIDGLMGQRTRVALHAYQESLGLPATGEPDRVTIEKLFAPSPPSPPSPAMGGSPSPAVGSRQAEKAPEPKMLSPPPSTSQSINPQNNAISRRSRRSEGISLWWWVGLAVLVYFIFRLRRRKKESTAQASSTKSGPALTRRDGKTTTITVDLHDVGWKGRGYKARSAADLRKKGDRCWVPPGKDVQIAGHRIQGGMVYVGDRLPDQRGYENENCLIDPALKVASSRADVSGEFMDYWPSYESMRASSRLAFLNWLSEGRSNPEAYIGYVFVFFYGLERRLILERAAEDTPRLISEVRRLRSLYSSNRSFSRYSSALIEAAAVIFGDGDLLEEPLFDRRGYEVPLRVKAAIGHRVRKGEGIPAEWMLSWVMTDPETRLGTPARRDFEAFRALFHKRFAARYPNGILIKTSSKKQLRHIYRAASGTFKASLDEHLKGLPDISQIRLIPEGPGAQYLDDKRVPAW